MKAVPIWLDEQPQQPRPTRRGFTLYKWPLEDLARVYACGLKAPGDAFALVQQMFPGIGQRYEQATGRPLTENVVRNRIDKATRQNEVERYRHLLPAAEEELRKATWRTYTALRAKLFGAQSAP
jgi:hypothetical protein